MIPSTQLANMIVYVRIELANCQSCPICDETLYKQIVEKEKIL